MIKIEITKTDKECTITAQGHAGYAPRGYDIVCAAVSTLVFTLIDALHDTKADHTFTQNSKTAAMDINVKLDKLNVKSLACIDMFITGIKLVSTAYPDYITVQTR